MTWKSGKFVNFGMEIRENEEISKAKPFLTLKKYFSMQKNASAF